MKGEEEEEEAKGEVAAPAVDSNSPLFAELEEERGEEEEGLRGAEEEAIAVERGGEGFWRSLWEEEEGEEEARGGGG